MTTLIAEPRIASSDYVTWDDDVLPEDVIAEHMHILQHGRPDEPERRRRPLRTPWDPAPSRPMIKRFLESIRRLRHSVRPQLPPETRLRTERIDIAAHQVRAGITDVLELAENLAILAAELWFEGKLEGFGSAQEIVHADE